MIDVLERNGAILKGHFRLSSGRHSDTFVQKFRVLERPRLAQSFGEAIAQQFDCAFEVVAAPAVGAIVLGFATALAGDARAIFAERFEGRLRFRRGFEIGRRERALIVEDVITTGSSAKEVVDLVRASGGEPVGVGALIDRTDPDDPPQLGTRLKALVKLDVPSWDPGQCPLCKTDEPLDDPGSRRL